MNQDPTVTIVSGIETAQYSHIFSETTHGSPGFAGEKLKKLVLKIAYIMVSMPNEEQDTSP